MLNHMLASLGLILANLKCRKEDNLRRYGPWYVRDLLLLCLLYSSLYCVATIRKLCDYDYYIYTVLNLLTGFGRHWQIYCPIAVIIRTVGVFSFNVLVSFCYISCQSLAVAMFLLWSLTTNVWYFDYMANGIRDLLFVMIWNNQLDDWIT